jgi:hypothetical protein
LKNQSLGLIFGRMNLVTVFQTFNIAEAHIVRSRLDAAEFHPVVANEIASVSIDAYTQATGGLLVQVPEDEARAARELIEECERSQA